MATTVGTESAGTAESVVETGKLPAEVPVEGSARAAPDLAAEVLSPSSTACKVEEKVADYFVRRRRAGAS